MGRGTIGRGRASALAVLLGGALLLGVWARPGVPATATTRSFAPAAPRPEAATLLLETPAPAPEATKVQAAFEKFQAAVKDITKEKLEEEQARMNAALEAARKTPTAEPTVERTVDESGLQWNKLTYPSGEVRYEFATD